MKRIFCMAVLVGSVFVVSAAVPEVSNVRASQGKYSRKVTINYDLTGASAVITLDVLTNGVSIGAANITQATGVGQKVEPGVDKEIVWDVLVSWPNHKIETESVDFKVTAWALDDPPPVMVVELTGDKAIRFYEDVAQLDGGVTNVKYKTDCLVFRKIPAKGAVFTMGGKAGDSGSRLPHKVGFTNDFYLGIYEVTQKQLLTMTVGTLGLPDGWRGSHEQFTTLADADLLPAQSVAYGRGDDANKYYSLMAWNQWSVTDVQGTRTINVNALLSKIRAHTGLKADLPTSAQWEFACRAGAVGPYYNGKGAEDLGEIAWYDGNCTNELTQTAEPHPVGLKAPNAFGLYDMLGNVWEYVLDKYWSDSYPFAAYEIEPPGPASNTGGTITARGGNYVNEAGNCMNYNPVPRYCYNLPDESSPYGFRLWAPAEVP
jgi:formylglycine-generating enzyme required for sulfatase activity